MSPAPTNTAVSGTSPQIAKPSRKAQSSEEKLMGATTLAGAKRMASVDTTVNDMFHAVTIVNPGGSYTLATEKSPLPLALRNDLPVPIRVRLQVDAPPGMNVTDIATAVARADVVYVLLADEVIPDVYPSDIAPHLRRRSAVCFGSGYVLAFGLVTPAADVDVLLLAPRMLGEEVRTRFLDGRGFFSYVSVEQDASGTAEARLLALALACGTLARGAMRLSAIQEARLDLLIEQTVGTLPGHGHPAGVRYRSGPRAAPGGAGSRDVHVRGDVTHVPDLRRGRLLPVRHFARAGSRVRGVSRRPRPRPQGDGRMFAEQARRIVGGDFAARLQAEKDAGYPTRATIEAILKGDDPLSQAEARVRKALGGR